MTGGLSAHAADAEGGASRQNEEGDQNHKHNDTGFRSNFLKHWMTSLKLIELVTTLISLRIGGFKTGFKTVSKRPNFEIPENSFRDRFVFGCKTGIMEKESRSRHLQPSLLVRVFRGVGLLRGEPYYLSS